MKAKIRSCIYSVQGLYLILSSIFRRKGLMYCHDFLSASALANLIGLAFVYGPLYIKIHFDLK
jgi:uncharacterized membrane protein